jgi:hypothetical protein
MVEPMLRKSTKLTPPPNRAAFRKLSEDPNWAKSSAEHDEAMRVKLRTDNAEPRLKKSTTETSEDSLATVRREIELPNAPKLITDTQEPKRAKLLNDIVDPKWRQFTSDIFTSEPTVHIPHMLSPLPNLANCLIDKVEPRLNVSNTEHA